MTILLLLIVVSTKEDILYLFTFFLQRHSPIKCSIKSDRNKVKKWILKFVVQQVGANLDAESVKMFTGHRVIKRSGGLSGCSGLFLRFLHPFC